MVVEFWQHVQLHQSFDESIPRRVEKLTTTLDRECVLFPAIVVLAVAPSTLYRASGN